MKLLHERIKTKWFGCIRRNTQSRFVFKSSNRCKSYDGNGKRIQNDGLRMKKSQKLLR